MRVLIGSDFKSSDFKNCIKEYLSSKGFDVIDKTDEKNLDFFESANILSKKEKKFCGNYFVAVIRNSEWEGWIEQWEIEQWEMENKSWEKMCFFDFFINFGLS